jgi:hypothetical protein
MPNNIRSESSRKKQRTTDCTELIAMESECANNHHSIVELEGQWILFDRRWLHTDAVCDKKQRHVSAEYIYFYDDGTIKLVRRTEKGTENFPLKNHQAR